jgi:putative aldouronate transport system permease protein
MVAVPNFVAQYRCVNIRSEPVPPLLMLSQLHPRSLAQSWAAWRVALREDWQLYMMLAPLLIWFAVFLYTPMAGLLIAFKDYSLFKGAAGSPWIGFENFAALAGDEQFWRAVGNTLTLGLLSLLLGFPAPLLLALMFNEIQHARWRRWAQIITYLPHFISGVIVAGLVVALLSPSSGAVNVVRAGLGFEKLYFLTIPEYFRAIYIGSGIWKEAGFESIVYLAAIAGISPSLYEAARIDGASRLQLIRHVTLPSLIPTVLVLLLIKVGHIIEVGFEYIVLLYQPATYATSDVISTYIYRAGLQQSDYGLAAAAGLANAIVALILVWGANALSRRYSATRLW